MGFKRTLNSVFEKTHLKEDQTLNDLTHMSYDELVAKNSSIRKAEAASTMGILGSACLSVVHPVALGGVLISGRQLYVSSKERDLVRQQLKRCAEGDPNFQKRFEQYDHPGWDMFAGMTVRAGFILLGNGIIDSHGIHDAFTGHNVAPTLVTNHGGQTIASAAVASHASSQAVPQSYSGGSHATYQHTQPDAARPDKVLPGVIGVIGDRFSAELASATGIPITSDTSWAQFATIWQKSTHGLVAVGVQTVVDGAVAETTQLTVIPEAMIEKVLEKKDIKRGKVFMGNMQGQDVDILILSEDP